MNNYKVYFGKVNRNCTQQKEINTLAAAAAAAKSLQTCPTLCNPIDGSPPGSPVPGILLARTLEWVAIAFSLNYGSCFYIFLLSKSFQLTLT